MLNIRINLTIDLKKVAAVVLAGVLVFSNIITPAHAMEAKRVAQKPEKVVTAHLTHMKLETTRTEAMTAIASPQAKFFDAEALTFLTVYTKGWSMKEWGCLRYIWNKESNFNPKARNKSSGAYGIAQFMPSTWGNYKVTKTEKAQLQIKYGLRYIESRYGTEAHPNGACNAQAFWVKHHWY